MKKWFLNVVKGSLVVVAIALSGCGDSQNKEGLSNLNKTVNAAVPGDSSITWHNSTSGSVYGMIINGGTVTGGNLFYQEANTAWSIVGQADFDGDSIKDLVWWNSTTGQVYIMLMSNSTTVKSGAVIYTEANTSWRIIATGDVNGDGKADLIWWNTTTGQVYAMLVNGASTTGGAIIYNEPNTNWKIVAAADFNGNGKLGLLWWNSSTGQVYLGQTNGLSTPTGAMIYTEPNTEWRIAGVGDLNGDGKVDIVWHNRTTGQVYGMQTNGTTITSGAMLYTEANTKWEIVSIGEYTNDNKADLLWWNQQTGQVYLMQMNGLAVTSGSSLYTEPNTTWRIQGETEWRDKVYGKGVTTTSVHPSYSNAMLSGYADQSTSVSGTTTVIYNTDGTYMYLSPTGNVPGTWQVKPDGTLLITFVGGGKYISTLQSISGNTVTETTVDVSAGSTPLTRTWTRFVPSLQYTTDSLSGKTFRSVRSTGTITVTFNPDNTLSFSPATGNLSDTWSINPDGTLQLKYVVNSSTTNWSRHLLLQINSDNSVNVGEINSDGSTNPNAVWSLVIP